MTQEKKMKVRLRAYLRSPAALRLLICLAGVAVLVCMFEVAIVPVRYNLAVGMVPNVTISASKDVVDEISTEKRRVQAAEAVTPTYRFQDGVTESVLSHFDQIFAQLRVVRQYGDTLPDQSAVRVYSKEELQYAKNMLTLITLRDYQLTSLLHSTQTELEEAYSLLYTALQSTMLNHVTEGQENAAAVSIRQIVSYRMSFPLSQNVAPTVLSACIQPNMLIDQEATEAARQEARAAVEPVIYKQGQNIVTKGEGRVTANQLAMLSALGLLNDGEVDLSMYLGAALLLMMVLVAMLLLLRREECQVFDGTQRLILLFVVLILALGLSMLARLVNSYLAPMLLCSLLITALLGMKCGLICNVTMTMLVASLAAGGSEAYAEKMAILIACGLISGTAAALALGRKANRLRVLLAGLLAAVTSFLTVLALGLMTANELSGTIATGLWCVGGALISALLCIASQPLLESIFNLPTPTKLLELSNPNQPLLRRLLLEAPGTYHHSIIVANLAEAAAEAIHANPLLARVGGYYHDVGKLKRPQYFKENQQPDDNAHDRTDPHVSAAIVTAHTRDGVALAKAYRLPQAVIDIIAEHHGDTPVMYFYHKALQMAGGKPVDINAFRYDGHPPRTKEAAIVMLCDTIEAAVRSLKNPTPESIEDFIVKLVRGKLEDGQLSDSPLTLQDIDKICAAATTVLVGVFHERIEYPDMEEQKPRILHQPEEVLEEEQEEAQERAEEALKAEEGNQPVVPAPVSPPLPRLQVESELEAPVVMPEAPEQLVEVEPPPALEPVTIEQLMPSKEEPSAAEAHEEQEAQDTPSLEEDAPSHKEEA